MGYTPLGRAVSARGHAERTYTVTYEDGRGVLRDLLAACTGRGWIVSSLAIVSGRTTPHGTELQPGQGLVSVGLTISGSGILVASEALGRVAGVVRVHNGCDDDE